MTFDWDWDSEGADQFAMSDRGANQACREITDHLIQLYSVMSTDGRTPWATVRITVSRAGELDAGFGHSREEGQPGPSVV